MNINKAPHTWNLTITEATKLQRSLAARVKRELPRQSIRYVAGVDLAYKLKEEKCIAGAVIWDIQKKEVIESQVAVTELTFPYVPGLLSFRETPAILAVLEKLNKTPDLVMCDGQGLAHPRRFGLACHVGIIINIPTIGCAKSRLVGIHAEVPPEPGSSVPLMVKRDQIGSVLRIQKDKDPIYVSVGHLIDLTTCEELVLKCVSRHRIPEPTRLADKLVADYKKSELK